MNETSLEEKYARLQEILRELESVAVAFSAGVDSTLLLKVAMDTLGSENVVAVTGRSHSLAQADFEEACRLAESLGSEHVILDTDELKDPNYRSNAVNRCYFCRITLYRLMERLIAERGIKAIVNGTNADDYGDYRPGIDAAREYHVHAPIAEAGMTKNDLRELSARFGLPTHDKPASPCLASRVPYGEAITPEKLRMIEAAEVFLHGMGIRECRVRHHRETARIEVPPQLIPTLAEPDNAARINEYFRGLGYNYVSLDLRGFRTGSLNEVIPMTALSSAW